MKIVLTAKIDGARFEDDNTGEIIKVYEGYELHIDDATCMQICEECGELVADIFYPKPETEFHVPEQMYSLSEWDVFVE